jgi:tryptophanyl-tRNA synthetase
MKRILSGMRPTGRLHLGHYHGVLKNWVRLQSEYETYYFVADWHALTTEYETPGGIKADTQEMVVDWLAVGLDPAKSVLFVQSDIKAHAELFVLFSMFTTIPRLERVPSYKDMQQNLAEKDLRTLGFLGYPVLQSADIAMYRANVVPVGEDQLPHLELTREIVRRFNNLYGPTFPEPDALLTETPRLPGVDGRKMSKSYGNAIMLSDSPEEIRKKVMAYVTDPARMKRTDAGNPDVCVLYNLHKIYSPEETKAEVQVECRRAGIGCVDCKKKVLGHMLAHHEPMIEKRAQVAASVDVRAVLAEGARKAGEVAEKTMLDVRKGVGL